MTRSCPPRAIARLSALLILALMAGSNAAAAKPPVVVATIQPLAALVAAVMQGAGAPISLIAPDQPPASFAFHDKDLDTLRQADVFFWIGPSLESGLAQPLADLEVGARMVQLTDTPGLLIYPPRHGGEWAADPMAPSAGGSRAPGEAGGPIAADGHIWLDADNVKLLIGRIAMTLTDADFGNAEVYRVNAARLRKRVDALDKEIAQRLAPLKDRPFLVLHDEYQYLEARYGLDAQGSIAVAATRLDASAEAEIAGKIRQVKAECIVGEPADAPVLKAISEAAKVRSQPVDIYSATAPNPADGFFLMLGRVADGFVRCLGGDAAVQAP